jgi:hypothetical protein
MSFYVGASAPLVRPWFVQCQFFWTLVECRDGPRTSEGARAHILDP